MAVSAQVGEWLKPADCKSAPPSGVRRFESFPVHQSLSLFSGRELAGEMPSGCCEVVHDSVAFRIRGVCRLGRAGV
jgi:hypothetical protein